MTPGADPIPMEGRRIHISGVVQGVGFRPFVYGLALRYHLHGWVRNTSSGVDIEIDGPPAILDEFAQALHLELPPLARIDQLDMELRPANGFTAFEIVASQTEDGAFQPISPDMTVCSDCLREMATPTDRRYRYPFINCTNCGPRFTIIRDIPYDRPLTTMADFPMCSDCAAEYHDPLDRRFHAQPVACPICGPHIWLEPGGNSLSHPPIEGEDALQATRTLLGDGRIMAIKGLGGFHLACDATNTQAVAELRRRKLRVDKPFAVMMPDLETVRRHCIVGLPEADLLESRARPIVILRRRQDSPLAAEIAPGQDHIGVMLPYTPLHVLLLEAEPGFPDALVMTSGNLSEEPIAYTNEQAHERLAKLADAFLFHNRDIFTRCDDSVMRVVVNETTAAPDSCPCVGRAAMRRFRCDYRGRRRRCWPPEPNSKTPSALPATIMLSSAITSATWRITRRWWPLKQGVEHLERLFRVRPEAIAYDLHPDYMATRYALERAEREDLPAIGVQHHHAHIAACMVEHGLSGDRPVIGVSFDGTGYGTDGAIWGGEFLIADYATARRAAHLRYIPLPGGDRAVREPWRMALAALGDGRICPGTTTCRRSGTRNRLDDNRLAVLQHQLATGLNAPPTSSMGRLFDAVAALIGVRQVVNYEAQAAVELEALVDPDETAAYPVAYTSRRSTRRPCWQRSLTIYGRM